MRYFFHLHDDITCEDQEGAEFANEADAGDHAISEARIMAAESVLQGHLTLSHHIRVGDAAGQTRFTVTFGEVVRIEQ